ncbi:MAG: surface-adhesin E family protein, partial [Rhizobiaceae bacterium]
MKKLTIPFVLIFSLIHSSTSYAAWEKMITDVEGNVHYVDFEKIKNHDGYVYFWVLIDLLKPFNYSFSSRYHYEGDCKSSKYKLLSVFIHKESMAGGSSKFGRPLKQDRVWKYPRPKSAFSP